WGRPMPTFWNRFWTVECDETNNRMNPAIYGPVSFEEAMTHPGELIVAQKSENSYNVFPEWCTKPETDLWGVEGEEATEGTKSIYDPCPKGYKVMSKPALEALVVSGAPVYDAANAGKRSVVVNGLTFISGGRISAKWQSVNSQQIQTQQMGENGQVTEGFIWTNFSANQGHTLYTNNSTGKFQKGTLDRANAAPIRCIKDNDNR
ncbi:MAG: hypothetical protein ACI3ZQ_11040, partial [Candidatus Cryptobacteroides sp.]